MSERPKPQDTTTKTDVPETASKLTQRTIEKAKPVSLDDISRMREKFTGRKHDVG